MSTMNGMKYLVFQFQGTHREQIYLFPAEVQHSVFASSMPQEWKPVRGGFVWFMMLDADGNTLEGKFQCYGQAFSLGLQSDPEKDLLLLHRELVQE